MGHTKVLIVDDSLFMRKLIARLIEEDPQLRVVGAARNGEEAVRMAGELLPDVITMDVEMPVMNGLEALARIMKERPVPVVMLSSLTQEGAKETIEALQLGAVDFIAKPSGSTSADLYKIKDEMRQKIKAAAAAPSSALRPIRREPYAAPPPPRMAVLNRSVPASVRQLIAIGTSTGGPRALDAVIGELPAGFPYPVLVVQHMPPKFTRSLADRLDSLSKLRVVEAEDGQPLRGGTVYIAPGDFHMTVAENGGEYRIQLNREPQRNGHRPSVDVLFESVARLSGVKRHYVLMTGMGADGAKGMLLAKESGAGTTIAEAKESCVVFGMPKAAIELGCVDHVVPLAQIPGKLLEFTQKS
ncbi:protein-glutamate methylesterase/protein-glutamine glutaminase [Cohnella caldifontis]|uniref:protein-glutamate methylesterase/protein-glutamine glutaminase n=1 Tax=Cohnella caldifontis TaxID=3027471 RepID=UPI0023EB9617|nr:chemotaxis response regulator protein-glutamate methylesterase [Cohnella sp. YIM B05605]